VFPIDLKNSGALVGWLYLSFLHAATILSEPVCTKPGRSSRSIKLRRSHGHQARSCPTPNRWPDAKSIISAQRLAPSSSHSLALTSALHKLARPGNPRSRSAPQPQQGRVGVRSPPARPLICTRPCGRPAGHGLSLRAGGGGGGGGGVGGAHTTRRRRSSSCPGQRRASSRGPRV
jgi:hypothetical protein